ncbi:hypothetical protein [Devosia sediminis]|uniref:Uncharacterized protein n=1 Tax=Devosia sediminis TaxID=2798801 RepID=A0A934MQM5_9HYPH|nr:hypothetical protein [Devosia sediminis]MBJ3784504.1 hypothetical protein [Devosia sediminis]
MAKIILAGKPLYDYTPLNVIDIASRRGHQRYDLGPCADAIRNREILHGFGGKPERTSSELIASEGERHPEWSDNFVALRVGESLGWAVEVRIVQRIPGGHVWRLLETERMFEIIGGSRKERSLRVRVHTDDAEAIVAAKLWQKELKRRDRARLKDIEKHRPMIVRLLDRIATHAPETKLPSHLARFAVGGFDDIGTCRQFVIDSLGDLDEGEPYVIELQLNLLAAKLPYGRAPKLSAEDVDALEGFAI